MRKFKKLLIVLLVFVVVSGIIAWYIHSNQVKQEQEILSQIFTPAFAPKRDFTDSSESESSLEGEILTVEPRSYSVSCSNDIVTDVGMFVLEAGGNAVDAAVAMAYTLSVVEPYASGLGGSGGMLVYDTNTQECKFYDYRAAAGLSPYSVDEIGVPGMVAGMEYVHNRYGTIPMDELMEPAVYYAENGFTVYSALSARMDVAQQQLSRYPIFYNQNGSYLSTGDTMYQPALAETLRVIQEKGADAFYNGEIAADIAANSALTKADLSSYQVYEYDALSVDYRGYTVYSANAPLSGVTVLQMLKMEELLDLPDPNSDVNGYLDALRKITLTAYSDRYSILGDPVYSNVDLSEKLSIDHIYDLLNLDVTDFKDDNESTETTSFSVIDSNGLVVSSTNTLSHFWGSKVMVDGFFLNNTNNNFSNCTINAYEPGKRSRTFTAPTIVTGEDGYVLAVGTPGGNNIPSVLFGVLVNVLKYGADPQEAVTQSRVIYRQGILTVEEDQNGSTWLNTAHVNGYIVWRKTGYWWGSVSLTGYSDATGAFAAYDYRRGATKAGIYNS